MKSVNGLLCLVLVVVIGLNQRCGAEEDDLFGDDDNDEASSVAPTPAAGKPQPNQQGVTVGVPAVTPGQAQVETTTVDVDKLWDEIWASGRSKVNWPKDEYGYSKQVSPDKLREKDLKFLSDVYHNKYAHKIHRYEFQFEKDWEAAKKAVEARLAYTYELIKDPYKDAKETAENLISMYKKDFNKAYLGAQHKIMDYIQPLIQWLKEDINSTKPDTKHNAKAKIETMALVHKTLEKSVADSKANVADNVLRNVNKKDEMAAKSLVYDVDHQHKNNTQTKPDDHDAGTDDGAPSTTTEGAAKKEQGDADGDHDHDDEELIGLAAAPPQPDQRKK